MQVPDGIWHIQGVKAALTARFYPFDAIDVVMSVCWLHGAQMTLVGCLPNKGHFLIWRYNYKLYSFRVFDAFTSVFVGLSRFQMSLVALNGCLRLKDNDLVSWVRASVKSGCIIPAIVVPTPSAANNCHQAWQDGFADALDADLETLGSNLVAIRTDSRKDALSVSAASIDTSQVPSSRRGLKC